MKQFVVTPSMGKRLIGKATARHPAVRAAVEKGTLVIVAGTTNGYVAEEVLEATGQADGFSRMGFRRGIIAPPGFDTRSIPAEFTGDVILVDGKRVDGKEIYDVVGDLQAGDVVVKGANAVNLCRRRAGVLIGHRESGTIGAALPAIVGRRVKLLIPVGLEKRVTADIADIADRLNAPGAKGPGLMPLPGEILTELDAVEILTGAKAELLAGGGTHGAEGAVRLGVGGRAEDVKAAAKLLKSLAGEPLCLA